MRRLISQVKRNALQFWTGLRQWSGDSAYERYLECAGRNGSKVALSEREFYMQQLEKKYSRPNRCC